MKRLNRRFLRHRLIAAHELNWTPVSSSRAVNKPQLYIECVPTSVNAALLPHR